MINKYLTVVCVLLMFGSAAFAQTSIEGKVIEEESGEPVIFGDVALYKNGVLVTGAQTDFDGNYSISNLEAGNYDIEASYIGFSAERITGVTLVGGKVTRVDFKLGVGINLEEVVITEYKKPLIEVDNTSSGGTLTSDDIQKLPVKNINAMASLTAGLASTDGGNVVARGSRSSGTDYYLDGIRVSGSLPAQSEIEQLTTLIGGIPASYGDVTGAVISLTSKGPSSRLSGGVEVETSEFLDNFGYNLLTANLSGPILKNDAGQSVIGFRVSGQYRNIDNTNPPATGVYRATEEDIAFLTENPLNENGVLNSEFDLLEQNGGGIQLLNARPNDGFEDLNLTAKIDFRIGGNLDISLSGNYIDSKDQFAGVNQTYNWVNNPFDNNTTYRGNLRIRHRLGVRNPGLNDGEVQTVSAIRNVSYTITAGYQHNEGHRQDLLHEDRMFEYGYVGNFDVDFVPSFGFDVATQMPFHEGYNAVATGYTPNNQGINPGWVALNKGQEGLENQITNVTSYNAYNGARNSLYSSAWNFHSTPGTNYNVMYKDEADRYTIDVRTNFDFVPGGSEKGRHSIEIGFLYEQRVSRVWQMNPQRLYSEARTRVNQPLFASGVDSTDQIGWAPNPFGGDSIAIYAPNVAGGVQLNFHKNIRDDLNIPYNEFINIDGIAPGDMKLDWFEPEELTGNQGLMTYYGYDYLGNKLGTEVTFDDFFADKDGNGKQDFLVAPFQPNYLSAFIQDKFSFKDIIFRLGVRMERYDANTKVLKDPYTLYDIMTADEFYANNPGETRPESVQDDYKVYTINQDSESVKAFRKGDQWYAASGSPVNDGSIIFGRGGSVSPYYKIRDVQERNIQDPNYVNQLDGSFVDYEPELTFAPRLSFSFPISDASNFFANYDILYQRPTAGVLATALDYYYFEELAASNTINNNPNLKPVQTTSYEIGFNQKISNSSALRIQAYYKEERDRVQARTLLQVASPIGNYTTYDNIDFATIKGFSFTYDLRRTGNVLALANYTLQFADGTGSDAQSQRTLSTSGQNIRTLSALNFDERHRFNLILDYRYSDGKRYNGPVLFGADIFANAGANLQLTSVSGQPYTKADIPTEFGGAGFAGGLNESRLPWITTLDLRVDKDFTLFANQEGKKPLTFNVYLRIQNLLDTRNVTGVYTYTGDPDDSGYLEHSRGQSDLNAVRQGEASGLGTEASYLDLYQAALLNPGFYTLPRRIYLGAYFNF